MCTVEYVWFSDESTLRSKVRFLGVEDPKVLEDLATLPDKLPMISANGRPYGWPGEIFLRPKACIRDPFAPEKSSSFVVLCMALMEDKESNGFRCLDPIFSALNAVESASSLAIAFEQDFAILGAPVVPRDGEDDGGGGGGKDDLDLPSWEELAKAELPKTATSRYCDVGAGTFEFVTKVSELCRRVGIRVQGFYAHADGPNQWQIQLEAASPLEAACRLTFLRFILVRHASERGWGISFATRLGPARFQALHATLRVAGMELGTEESIEVTRSALQKLSATHGQHLPFSGRDNVLRLGEKGSMEFVGGVGYGENDGHSVRIPSLALKSGRPFLQDRRYGASANPFSVVGALATTLVPKSSTKTFETKPEGDVDIVNVD